MPHALQRMAAVPPPAGVRIGGGHRLHQRSKQRPHLIPPPVGEEDTSSTVVDILKPNDYARLRAVMSYVGITRPSVP